MTIAPNWWAKSINMNRFFVILVSFLLLVGDTAALAVALQDFCPVTEDTCCCSDCDSMMSCCEADNEVPPSALPGSNEVRQNLVDLRTVAHSVAVLPGSVSEFVFTKSQSLSPQSIPIFKRHCRFLI